MDAEDPPKLKTPQTQTPKLLSFQKAKRQKSEVIQKAQGDAPLASEDPKPENGFLNFLKNQYYSLTFQMKQAGKFDFLQ